MAGDREITNEGSGVFHEAEGYQEAERIVFHAKSLVAREIDAIGSAHSDATSPQASRSTPPAWDPAG